MWVMYHDDSCGVPLDQEGCCPSCGFHPDMQSTGFTEIQNKDVLAQVLTGRTFLGQYRSPINLTTAKELLK